MEVQGNMSACVCNTFLTPQNWHRLVLCNRAPELKFPSVVSDSLCDKMALDYGWLLCRRSNPARVLLWESVLLFPGPDRLSVDFALYCISLEFGWICIVLYQPTLVDSLVDRRKRWHFFQLEPTQLCIAPPHQLLQSFTSQNHLCNMKIMIFFKLWINWTYRDYYRQECSLQFYGPCFLA